MDTRLNDMSGLLLKDVRWKIKTAGPSPFDNDRTELFLLGCRKALAGSPCTGCFNQTTWNASEASFSHDPVLMAEHINKVAPNKYITISGGEPTDQLENLVILCRELKKYGFHIMVYTYLEIREIKKFPTIKYEDIDGVKKDQTSLFVLGSTIFPTLFKELLNYVDIIVDGEYRIEESLWDGTKGDGFVSSVGSGNQIIWDMNNKFGYAMRDIQTIKLDSSNSLTYVLKDNATKIEY